MNSSFVDSGHHQRIAEGEENGLETCSIADIDEGEASMSSGIHDAMFELKVELV